MPKKRRPGKIDQLPAEFQDLVGRMLAQGHTKASITRALNEALESAGREPVGRMSVNRYTKRMLSEGQRLREIHEASQAFMRTIGSIDGGEVDAYLVEMVRMLAVEHINLFAAADAEDKPSVKQVADMALALQRMAKSQEVTDKRIAAIRSRSADQAATAGRKAGLSEDIVNEIRDEIMGAG